MAETAGTSFAALLKRHRIAAGLTQEELAERAQLSVRAISDLERGLKQRPYPHTVRRLTQALEMDADAANRLAAASRRRGEAAPAPGTLPLPLQPTPFIGRRHEVADVARLLGHDGVRLLSLTGPGGVGKTRLAFRVAEEVANRFPDGIAVVPLAPLTDPALVASAVALAANLVETPGHQLLEALERYFFEKRLLLILDNFEHLLPAASLVSELLAACPRLTVLVTSRAVLHLAAEHDYTVPPLDMPHDGGGETVERLGEYDAIALFVARARAAKAGFSLTEENAQAVAELCQRLEGLPLAIELAAAHSRLLSPQALVRRLESRLQVLTGGANDLPARQRTMRATIDWSHSLLSEKEQTLFRRLAVFVGGCPLEVAETVCADADDRPGDVLARLESLVDKNLLAVEERDGEPRFRILEVVREYAIERLAASGETGKLHRRHAEAFLRLAEDTGDGDRWPAHLTPDLDNLRAALSLSLETGVTGDMTVRLAAALVPYWLEGVDWTEGRQRLEKVMDAVVASGVAGRYPREWGKVVTGIAVMAGMYDSDFATAETFAEQAAAIWRRLGDKRWLSKALHTLEWVSVRRGDHDRAQALGRELVEISYAVGSSVDSALFSLAMVELHRGNLAAARSRLEEGLMLSRTSGNTSFAVIVLSALAEVAWCQGDAAGRQAFWEEALSGLSAVTDFEAAWAGRGTLAGMARRVGDYERAEQLLQERLSLAQAHPNPDESWWFLGWSLNHLGDLALCQDDLERATSFYEESMAVFRRHRERQGIAALSHNLGHVELARGNAGRARTYFLESLALFRELRFDWSMADCLSGLAGVASQEGRPERAALLFGAVEAVQRAIDLSGILTEPTNERARNRDIAIARGQLDPETCERAWSAGQAMSLEEAIAFALGAEAEKR
jgi:predicted ATPase/transcriptional regulator with XRE-family HTH domain